MQGVYLIAEAGVNHNGKRDMALALVDAAAAAGADAVKFQTFWAEALVTATARKANYQTANTGDSGSQFDMLRQLELDADDHFAIRQRCIEKGVDFLSTPFDPESMDFLVKEMGVERLKIGSGDLTNAPLIHRAGASGRPLILSTGMATLDEIEVAVGAFALGRLGQAPSGVEELRAASAAADLGDWLVLLLCTTAYPTPLEDVNLRAMDSLAARFNVPVGFSDHTPGALASVAAAARGARVIEKHITLDCSLPGPDHRASLEPEDFGHMVRQIRATETLLGSAEKTITPTERSNSEVARKSLRAARSLKAGITLSAADIAVKRPADGLDARYFWDLLGKRVERDYNADEAFDGALLGV